MERKKTWDGGTYKRGGLLHTKWGTTFKRQESFRTPSSGGVVHSSSKDGKLLGVERVGDHSYGTDPKQASEQDRKRFKRLTTYVKSHPRRGTKGVTSHPRRLR